MTKAPLGGEKTGPNPTDRAKAGAKRSLITDANGIPVGLAADAANRNEMKLVTATLGSIPEPVEALRQEARQNSPVNLCLDKGYDFTQVRELVEAFGFKAHIRSRGEEKQQKKRSRKFKARRWGVKRTHSWMNRYRRLRFRWEKKVENCLAILHFTCACIAWKSGLFG